MSRNKPDSPTAYDALRQVLQVHDSAAIGHMKAANRHLKQASAVACRLEQLKPTTTEKRR